MNTEPPTRHELDAEVVAADIPSVGFEERIKNRRICSADQQRPLGNVIVLTSFRRIGNLSGQPGLIEGEDASRTSDGLDPVDRSYLANLAESLVAGRIDLLLGY